MFYAEELITILDQVVDDAEKVGYTSDQATILAVATSLHALATATVEAWQHQNNADGSVHVSPEFIHGLLDKVQWMGSRLQISRL